MRNANTDGCVLRAKVGSFAILALASSPPMTRRHLHRWTLWVLPLLVARWLVPAGFMLSPVTGMLELCPGALPQVAASEHQHHHAHHAGSAAQTGELADEPAQPVASMTCPFAVGVTFDLPELTSLSPARTQSADQLDASLDVAPPYFAPEPTHLIRGPPPLS